MSIIDRFTCELDGHQWNPAVGGMYARCETCGLRLVVYASRTGAPRETPRWDGMVTG